MKAYVFMDHPVYKVKAMQCKFPNTRAYTSGASLR